MLIQKSLEYLSNMILFVLVKDKLENVIESDSICLFCTLANENITKDDQKDIFLFRFTSINICFLLRRIKMVRMHF